MTGVCFATLSLSPVTALRHNSVVELHSSASYESRGCWLKMWHVATCFRLIGLHVSCRNLLVTDRLLSNVQ